MLTAGIVLLAGINGPVSAGNRSTPKDPTPLVPGKRTRGTVLDNQVGSQYWSFRYVAGKANISVRLTSMGLFGNPTPATIEVVLHNPDGKVFGSRPLTSNAQARLPRRTGQQDFWGATESQIIEIKPSGFTKSGARRRRLRNYGQRRGGQFFWGSCCRSRTNRRHLLGDGVSSRLRLSEQSCGTLSRRWDCNHDGWPQRSLDRLLTQRRWSYTVTVIRKGPQLEHGNSYPAAGLFQYQHDLSVVSVPEQCDRTKELAANVGYDDLSSCGISSFHFYPTVRKPSGYRSLNGEPLLTMRPPG